MQNFPKHLAFEREICNFLSKNCVKDTELGSYRVDTAEKEHEQVEQAELGVL